MNLKDQLSNFDRCLSSEPGAGILILEMVHLHYHLIRRAAEPRQRWQDTCFASNLCWLSCTLFTIQSVRHVRKGQSLRHPNHCQDGGKNNSHWIHTFGDRIWVYSRHRGSKWAKPCSTSLHFALQLRKISLWAGNSVVKLGPDRPWRAVTVCDSGQGDNVLLSGNISKRVVTGDTLSRGGGGRATWITSRLQHDGLEIYLQAKNENAGAYRHHETKNCQNQWLLDRGYISTRNILL